MIDYLSRYMSLGNLEEIALKNNLILSLTEDDAEAIYNTFKRVGCSIEAINEILTSNPYILSESLSQVEASAQSIYSICESNTPYILEAYPEIILRDAEELESFLKNHPNKSIEDALEEFLSLA